MCSLLLCLCLALSGCAASGGDDAPPAETPRVETPQSFTEEAEPRPLTPGGRPTHEEIVQGALDLISGAQDSCARMLEEAEAKGGEAVEIAEAARAESEPRLTELAGLDYAAMADEEIYEYTAEVSDIITALREARDSIGALD